MILNSLHSTLNFQHSTFWVWCCVVLYHIVFRYVSLFFPFVKGKKSGKRSNNDRINDDAWERLHECLNVLMLECVNAWVADAVKLLKQSSNQWEFLNGEGIDFLGHVLSSGNYVWNPNARLGFIFVHFVIPWFCLSCFIYQVVWMYIISLIFSSLHEYCIFCCVVSAQFSKK